MRPYAPALESLESELLDPVFLTLGKKPAENVVREITPSALYVDTEASRSRGKPEPIPAWMLNLAWKILLTRGSIDNGVLLDDMRVHRSSAVLAILARLPGVEPIHATKGHASVCDSPRGDCDRAEAPSV